jgi:hypothetical protein
VKNGAEDEWPDVVEEGLSVGKVGDRSGDRGPGLADQKGRDPGQHDQDRQAGRSGKTGKGTVTEPAVSPA